MADVTITTDEPAGDSTGVAAGMAMAVADQAAEDAEVAVAQAEQATEQAGMAEVIAAEAAGEAYNAQEDVTALRNDFTAFAERIEAALTARPAEPAVVEVAEPAPEPAPASDGDGGGGGGKASKAKQDKGSEETKLPRYGSRMYWGER